MSGLHATTKRQIEHLQTLPDSLPAWTRHLQPGELVRLLRQYLKMSQAQLARRSGVPQAKIARIESMKTDFRWSTLSKLLAALEAEPLVLPRARTSWTEWLRGRARRVAEQRVNRVLGTSALEAQQPSELDRQAMVNEETSRLLDSGGQVLWDEE
jgi:transcriptional regulator with XRE-family HTH domain